MRDIQTVTIYFHVVYVLAAVIFGGYAATLVRAARRAKERVETRQRQS